MKGVLQLMGFLLVVSCAYSNEINTNSFFLVLSDDDVGAIDDAGRRWGIASFKRDQSGRFTFQKMEQYFPSKGGVYNLMTVRNFIIAEGQQSKTCRIINLKSPEKHREYQPNGWGGIFTSNEYPDSLIRMEFRQDKGCKVSEYNILTRKENIIDASGLDSVSKGMIFYITDAIRYAPVGLENRIYLPKPPEDFLRQGDNRKFVLPVRPALLKSCKDYYRLVKVSSGHSFIYFYGDQSTGRPLVLWIYNKKDKNWISEVLPQYGSNLYDFGDRLAVRHTIRAGALELYTGTWTFYTGGRKQKEYLGLDTIVLYFSAKWLIFSESNRLYACPVTDGEIDFQKMQKIAENNNIRYATRLFFAQKEKRGEVKKPAND